MIMRFKNWRLYAVCARVCGCVCAYAHGLDKGDNTDVLRSRV